MEEERRKLVEKRLREIHKRKSYNLNPSPFSRWFVRNMGAIIVSTIIGVMVIAIVLIQNLMTLYE